MELEEIRKNTQLCTTAIIAYVAKIHNAFKLSPINKLLGEFDLPKVSKQDILDLAELFADADSDYGKVFQLFVDGEYTLEDLRVGLTGNKIQEVLSPYVVAHEKVLGNNREFNRIQREGAWMQILLEESDKHLEKLLKSTDLLSTFTPNVSVRPSEEHIEGTELTVLIGDWHIGASVHNKDTGGYNFSILQRRLVKYLQAIEKTAKRFNVTRIHIANLGDNIEHINMRNVNQAFEVEFPATEQIAKATRLLLDFIQKVEQLAPTNYYMIAGNHDRFQGNKNDAVYNDSVAYVILDHLLLLQKYGAMQNTQILNNLEDVYSAEYTTGGKIVHLDHGHTLPRVPAQVIPRLIKTHPIDILVTGHVHNAFSMQEDFDRLHIINSSPMGANNYSKDLKLPATTPSQTMFLVGGFVDGIIQQTVFL